MQTFDSAAGLRSIYERLLQNWNANNAKAYADLFTEDANVIGFDGSMMNGREAIFNEINRIFKNHTVASYVGIIKEIRALGSTVFLLRAVAGMIAPGQSRINPKVNSVQTLIAQKNDDELRICLFQNTPAAFHERPDLTELITNELQQAAKAVS